MLDIEVVDDCGEKTENCDAEEEIVATMWRLFGGSGGAVPGESRLVSSALQ
jgi:hypothetical protein